MEKYVIIEHTFKNFKNPTTIYASSLIEAYELCNKKYEKIIEDEKIVINKDDLTHEELLFGKSLLFSRNYEILCLLFLQQNYDNLHN